MADPRFFKNLGPFSLAQICEKIGIALPPGSDGAGLLFDLADLGGAGPRHVTFYSGARGLQGSFAASKAGLCLVPSSEKGGKCPPPGMSVLEVASVGRAFAAIAALFYPEHSQPRWPQRDAISPDAKIGRNVEIAPHVVIAPGAEIGDGTRLGPGTVIGPCVAVDCHCEIGACVTISHAHIGDRVTILP